MKVRSYQCLSILVKEFNEAFMLTYGSIHIAQVPLVMLLFYAAVRFSGFVSLGFAWMAVVIVLYALAVMVALANSNQTSKELIFVLKRGARPSSSSYRSITDRTEYAAAWREAETLRELRISVGPVFYFDKPLVLTVIEAMLVQSANLLLM